MAPGRTSTNSKRQLLNDWMTGLRVIEDKHLDSIISRLSNYYVDDNGCWHCYSKARVNGYVFMSVLASNQVQSKHTLSYRVFVHCIYPGLEIAHTCKNRSCFNPCHLRQQPTHLNRLRDSAWYPNDVQDTLELVGYLDRQ